MIVNGIDITVTDWYQGVEYGVIIHFNKMLYDRGLIKTKWLLTPCDSEVLK